MTNEEAVRGAIQHIRHNHGIDLSAREPELLAGMNLAAMEARDVKLPLQDRRSVHELFAGALRKELPPGGEYRVQYVATDVVRYLESRSFLGWAQVTPGFPPPATQAATQAPWRESLPILLLAAIIGAVVAAALINLTRLAHDTAGATVVAPPLPPLRSEADPSAAAPVVPPVLVPVPAAPPVTPNQPTAALRVRNAASVPNCRPDQELFDIRAYGRPFYLTCVTVR